MDEIVNDKACESNGNYGLCKIHPTCDLIHKRIKRLIRALKGCDELFDNYGFADESPCKRDREIIKEMQDCLEENKTVV